MAFIFIEIALAYKQRILLADEPTGCVDSKNTHRILDIFRKVNKTIGRLLLTKEVSTVSE